MSQCIYTIPHPLIVVRICSCDAVLNQWTLFLERAAWRRKLKKWFDHEAETKAEVLIQGPCSISDKIQQWIGPHARDEPQKTRGFSLTIIWTLSRGVPIPLFHFRSEPDTGSLSICQYWYQSNTVQFSLYKLLLSVWLIAGRQHTFFIM